MRAQMLPEAFAKALAGEGEGGLLTPQPPGVLRSAPSNPSTGGPDGGAADAPGARGGDGAASSSSGPDGGPAADAKAPALPVVNLKQRRALAKQRASGGTSFIRSLTSIMPVGRPGV